MFVIAGVIQHRICSFLKKNRDTTRGKTSKWNTGSGEKGRQGGVSTYTLTHSTYFFTFTIVFTFFLNKCLCEVCTSFLFYFYFFGALLLDLYFRKIIVLFFLLFARSPVSFTPHPRSLWQIKFLNLEDTRAHQALGSSPAGLTLVEEESEAPFSSSMTATSWCPSRAARWSGV